MENINSDSNKSPISKVNISLCPERHYKKQARLLPLFPRRTKSNKKFEKTLKSNDTYSVAYIGDRKGKLDIFFKRFSIPKLSHRQISRKHHAVAENKDNIQTFSSYSIHKYFRPKALTPTNVRISDGGDKSRSNVMKLNRWR